MADNNDVDVVVVGAGFSGIYLLHELRRLGFSARVLESADDVGGTWYWNRYPGARCDIPTTDYTYSWDPELEHQWTWSEKYATQPEILRYAQFVTEKHGLRPHITFETKVVSAHWDDVAKRWHVATAATGPSGEATVRGDTRPRSTSRPVCSQTSSSSIAASGARGGLARCSRS